MKNINTKMVKAICPNCGVELVCIMNNPAVKCHWCQTMIPANSYIETPNMPDLILPFKIDKEEAKKNISKYINKIDDEKLNSISSKNIEKEIIPVYLPYMLVDINAHSKNRGQKKQRYKNKKYLSTVKKTRDFDIIIKNIIIETSKNNSFNAQNSTSDAVNKLLPFDVENSVEFNANYLNGYYSENREINTTDIEASVRDILKQIVDHEIDKMDKYSKEEINWVVQENAILGIQWTSIYLPVWIYSYCVKENNENKIYYIAVNGRTGKTAEFISNEKIEQTKFPIILILINLLLFIYEFYQIMTNTTPSDADSPSELIYYLIFFTIAYINMHIYQRFAEAYIGKHMPTYPVINGIDQIERTLYNLNFKDEFYE